MENANHTAYTISRNSNQEVQFAWRHYKERVYGDIRIWFKPENEDEMKPTQRGVNISLEQWPEFLKGVQALDAYIRAHASGNSCNKKS